MKAADVMATKVITVDADASVEMVAETLLANKISAVPVVDGTGKMLGIVSEGDLIHRVEAGTERHRSWWLALLTARETLAQDFIKSHARKASDLMSHPVVSVAPGTPLSEVAALLDKHRIKRVPVVQDGKLVGIVSRANLVQALVAQGFKTAEKKIDDAALQADVLSSLRAQPWWPTDVNVTVHDGNVELWGVVDSAVEKDAIRVAVEEIPGVRGISNYISTQQNVPRGL
ncbi:MAG: CBS domain-containing protein [Pseudolabrys sp.]